MEQNGKTIRQIADELGVSKTAVRKKITDEVRTKFAETVSGTVFISLEGEALIKSEFKRKPETEVSDKFPQTSDRFPQTNEETSDRFPQTSGKLPETSDRFPQTSGKLPETSDRFPQTSGKLPETSDRFPQTSGKLPETSDRFPQTSGKLPETSDRFPQTSGKLPETNEEVPTILAFFQRELDKRDEQLTVKDGQIAELNARLGEASAQMSDLTAALVSAQQTAQAAQALHAGTLQAQLGDGSKRGGLFARLFGSGRNRSDGSDNQ